MYKNNVLVFSFNMFCYIFGVVRWVTLCPQFLDDIELWPLSHFETCLLIVFWTVCTRVFLFQLYPHPVSNSAMLKKENHSALYFKDCQIPLAESPRQTIQLWTQWSVCTIRLMLHLWTDFTTQSLKFLLWHQTATAELFKGTVSQCQTWHKITRHVWICWSRPLL